MDRIIRKVEKLEKVTVLSLELDSITMNESQELVDKFTGLIAEGGRSFILDLSGTNFIPSIVIASLVMMLKRAKENGADLVICGLRDTIKKVFEITNLTKVFIFFDTKEEALKRYA
ncbi:MAG: STAS domain-containing protein [Candidatus Omnitrophota bacterium]